MSRESIAAFFAAAAEYYRRMPWRGVGGLPIEVGCDKFQSGPWYAVVLGESASRWAWPCTKGWTSWKPCSPARPPTANGPPHLGHLVTFGEAFEMPIHDLDPPMRSRWPLASPDAYPCAMRVNPGGAVRPPLAWELELLEGCLRSIPDFVVQEAWESVRDVPVASGELTLQLMWVAEDEEGEFEVRD